MRPYISRSRAWIIIASYNPLERVIVLLHLKSENIPKVWRFDPLCINQYTRKDVEYELIGLFPDISRRGLKLNLWYEDDLAGDVSYIISIP